MKRGSVERIFVWNALLLLALSPTWGRLWVGITAVVMMADALIYRFRK